MTPPSTIRPRPSAPAGMTGAEDVLVDGRPWTPATLVVVVLPAEALLGAIWLWVIGVVPAPIETVAC